MLSKRNIYDHSYSVFKTTQSVLSEFSDDPLRCFLAMEKQRKKLILSAIPLKNIISKKSLY